MHVDGERREEVALIVHRETTQATAGGIWISVVVHDGPRLSRDYSLPHDPVVTAAARR
jgi:hypothetical protein